MEFEYNYAFSQKVLRGKMILLATCMFLGILIATWQMMNTTSIQFVLFSVIFTLGIAISVIYFVLVKNWHLDRKDFTLQIKDKNIIFINLKGEQSFNMNEIGKVEFIENTNQSVIEIILHGKMKYRINNLYRDLDKISIAIREMANDFQIETIVKKRNPFYSIASALIVLTVLSLSYYIQYTGKTILIRSIANNIIPIVGGVVLLFLPKFEKGFLRGNRKNILSILMILLSITQIVLGIE